MRIVERARCKEGTEFAGLQTQQSIRHRAGGEGFPELAGWSHTRGGARPQPPRAASPEAQEDPHQAEECSRAKGSEDRGAGCPDRGTAPQAPTRACAGAQAAEVGDLSVEQRVGGYQGSAREGNGGPWGGRGIG